MAGINNVTKAPEQPATAGVSGAKPVNNAMGAASGSPASKTVNSPNAGVGSSATETVNPTTATDPSSAVELSDERKARIEKMASDYFTKVIEKGLDPEEVIDHFNEYELLVGSDKAFFSLYKRTFIKLVSSHISNRKYAGRSGLLRAIKLCTLTNDQPIQTFISKHDTKDVKGLNFIRALDDTIESVRDLEDPTEGLLEKILLVIDNYVRLRS